LQRQKKEHQKRAKIIRKAYNMDNEEIYIGKNLIASGTHDSRRV
jgi:hypothetical protein